MLWTALGLLIATIVSVEEAVTSEKPHRVKVLVILLAVAGLASYRYGFGRFRK